MRILALSILDLEGVQVQKIYVCTALVAPSWAGGVCAAAHSSIMPSFHIRALLLWVEGWGRRFWQDQLGFKPTFSH